MRGFDRLSARWPRLDRLGSRLPSFGRVAERRPRVGVRLGPWLPGWVLRLVCAVIPLGCAVLTGGGRAGLWLTAAAGVALLVRPGGLVPAVAAVGIGVLLLADQAGPLSSHGFVLLAATHAMAALAAVVGRTTWSVRVELATLLPPLRRYVAVQAVAQVVALAGAVLTVRSVQIGWFPVLGVVVLAGLVFVVPGRLARDLR